MKHSTSETIIQYHISTYSYLIVVFEAVTVVRRHFGGVDDILANVRYVCKKYQYQHYVLQLWAYLNSVYIILVVFSPPQKLF